MQFEFPKNQNSIIKVIGVGGGGGNAVNNMFLKGIDGVDFVICNTDVQALKKSPVPMKVRLGVNQTEGLGAGANPEVGKKAAVESLEEVRALLKENARMAFITAGMGGGTGTGAAPVIAAMAKEMGVLTVGIVTIPFKFEGPKRIQQAMEGITELEKMVDTLIVIDNNNLLKILGNKVSMINAFREADNVLCNAAKGIAEIIMTEGYVNVDFADVCTVMRDGGRALMGTAVAAGDDRAIKAAEAAINSPLLNSMGIQGSRAIIVNITASTDTLGMEETTQIVEYIQETAGIDANIIYGIVYDDEMANDLRVTVIATRFEDDGDRKPLELASLNAKKQQTKEKKDNKFFQKDLDEEMYDLPNESNMTETERETLRRLNQKEREERIKRLNSKVYDIHDPESLQKLENQPAYLRKKVTLEDNAGKVSHTKLSGTSMEEGKDGKFKIKEHNPFLHDNVD